MCPTAGDSAGVSEPESRVRRWSRRLTPPGLRGPKPEPPAFDVVVWAKEQRELSAALWAGSAGLGAAAVALLAVIRVFRVSGGSLTTALGLWSSVGPLQVIGGAALQLLPYLGVILIIFINASRDNTSPGSPDRKTALFTSFIVLLAVSAILAWPIFLMVAVVLAAPLILRLVTRPKPPSAPRVVSLDEWVAGEPPVDRTLRTYWNEWKTFRRITPPRLPGGATDLSRLKTSRETGNALVERIRRRELEIEHAQPKGMRRLLSVTSYSIMIVLISQLTLSETVWLPAEVIRIDDGTSVIGYVLNQTEREVLILTEERRNLRFVPVEDLLSREFCVVNDNGETISRTVLDLGTSPESPYPTCDDLAALDGSSGAGAAGVRRAA